MQRLEHNITYFEDIVPSKFPFYCWPVPPYNGSVCFYLPSLFFGMSSNSRKSALIILHSSPLLEHIPISPVHRSHVYLHKPTYLVASHYFLCWRGACNLSSIIQRKLICCSYVVQNSLALSMPGPQLSPTTAPPGCILPCYASRQGRKDTASGRAQCPMRCSRLASDRKSLLHCTRTRTGINSG